MIVALKNYTNQYYKIVNIEKGPLESKYTINNKINFYITLETYKIFFHIIKIYKIFKIEKL